MSAIGKAVVAVGGQTALANILKVKQQLVWGWTYRQKQAPAKHIIAISKATNGAISVDELLSDHTKQ